MEMTTIEVTKEERQVIEWLRKNAGIECSSNKIEITDGIATHWISSEDTYLITIIQKIVDWSDGDYINYLRKRHYEYKEKG